MTTAGALAVPIHFERSWEDDIKPLMHKLNGILFTGGGLDLYFEETQTFNPYYVIAAKIIDYAKEINLNGTHFPLWFTCQGAELITIYAANDPAALGKSRGQDYM